LGSASFISDNSIPFSGGGEGSGGGTGGGGGSDSDDTSENSTAGGCTPLTNTETVLSSRSPRPSKYNFYVELGKNAYNSHPCLYNSLLLESILVQVTLILIIIILYILT
jgi:hypothetical protein